MLGVDLRAFVIISAAFGSLCAFILFVLRSGFPREIKGIDSWAWGCVLMAVAALLFAARGAIPVFFSSFLPNLLVAAGVAAMHGGITAFGNADRHFGRLGMVLGAGSAALAWATFVNDDYRSRIIIMSSMLALLFALSGRAAFRLPRATFAERFTGFVFTLTAVIMLVRCATAFQQPSSMTPETDDTLVHKVYMATFAFSIVALTLGFMMIVNRALHAKLESLAAFDKMTGVYRRDTFLALLEREIAKSRLSRRPMAVLMMDLDNFKDVNDRYGHLIGDLVITDFSTKVSQALRSGDVVGRYGGEEFLVLLPSTSSDAARTVAERIRAVAAEVRSPNLPPYTVSIGVALLRDSVINTDALVDVADKALYAAKKAGKNRVELAAGPLHPQ